MCTRGMWMFRILTSLSPTKSGVRHRSILKAPDLCAPGPPPGFLQKLMDPSWCMSRGREQEGRPGGAENGRFLCARSPGSLEMPTRQIQQQPQHLPRMVLGSAGGEEREAREATVG